MVGNVEGVKHELQVATVAEGDLLLESSVVHLAVRTPLGVGPDHGNQRGAGGAVPVASDGSTHVRADADRIGQAVLELEAVVQAPVIGQVLHEIGCLEVREIIERISHGPVGNVVGRIAVVDARIGVGVVPVVSKVGGVGLLRKIQSVRPGVVDVELNAVHRAVENLEHHGIVVRIDVADQLVNALEVCRIGAEESRVAVGGVGWDRVGRSVRQRAQSRSVANCDHHVCHVAGNVQPSWVRSRIEVEVETIGQFASQGTKVASLDVGAMAEAVLHHNVELLHRRWAQIGSHEV